MRYPNAKTLFFMFPFLILLSCNKKSPTEATNNSPRIQSVSANPAQVHTGGISVLSAVATDADKDQLTYSWYSQNGSFPDGTASSSVNWKAPDIPGTYICTIIVSDGINTDKDSVNISVTKPPTLSVSPQLLYFDNDATIDTFTIKNSGSGVLNWSINNDISWISCTPNNGTIESDSQLVTVLANREGLTVGSHSDELNISSDGGSVSITVTIEVMPQPEFNVNPDFLDFDETESEIKIAISNTGTGNFDWDIFKDKSWISIFPASGNTSTETDSVTIQVDRSVLSPGTYTGDIHFWVSWIYINTLGQEHIFVYEYNIPYRVVQSQEYLSPVLISPVNDAFINNGVPTFDWYNVSGAVEYHIQIDDNAEFNNTEIDELGLTVSTYTSASPLLDETYYWRVRAKDNTGTWGSWTACWSFSIDTESPLAPTLTSPPDGTITNDNTPTFDWFSTETVEEYHIQVDTDNGFLSPIIDMSYLTASTYTPVAIINDGTYYWRAKSKDKAGNWSEWSSVWSFTLNTQGPSAPGLTSPEDGLSTTDNTPTFDWGDVEETLIYQIQVDNNSNFPSPTINQSDLSASTFTPIYTIPDGDYYWRVRGKNALDNWSDWSETWTITIDTQGPVSPNLISPVHRSEINDNTPTFVWNHVIDAVEYQIQIDYTRDFDNPEIEVFELTDSSYTILTPQSDRRYYWRIRGKDNVGNWGNWSAEWFFSIDTEPPDVPIQITPYTGSITNDNTPAFSWNDDPEVSCYYIQVDIDSNFISPDITDSNIVIPEYTPSHTLDDGLYYWRIKANDWATNVSDWSNIWYLTIDTQAPSEPNLISPIDQSTIIDDTPTFDWSNVSDAFLYQLQVDDNDNFSTPMIDRSDIHSSDFTTEVSIPDGTYYWRVRVRDEAGNWSYWSTISGFSYSRLKWSTGLGDFDASSPAIGLDGTLYTIVYSNNAIYALDTNGNVQWHYDGFGGVYGPAVGSDGTIYSASYSNIYALNPNGSLKWQFLSEDGAYLENDEFYEIGGLNCIAIGFDGTIYTGCWLEGSMTGYLRKHYFFAIKSDGSLKWKYEIEEQIEERTDTPPSIGPDGTVYFIPRDNYLYAVDSTGILQWRLIQGDGFNITPAIHSDGTIYVGSSNTLYALNPDGSPLWEYEIGDYLESPVIGSDGTIYTVSSDHAYSYSVWAFYPNGTLKWETPLNTYECPTPPTIGFDGTIYVGSASFGILGWGDGEVIALNPNGTVKWRYEAGTYMSTVPTIGSDGTLYWGTGGGSIIALYSSSIGLANSPWPKYRHDNQNTGRSE